MKAARDQEHLSNTQRRRPRLQFWLGFFIGIAALVAVGITAVIASSGSAPSSSPEASKPVVPAISAMKVFGNTAAPTDSIPAKFDGLVARLTPPSSVQQELNPGAPNPEDSRLVLSDLGTTQASLYAFPTDKGNVCFIFTGGPVAGCVPSFGGQVAVPYSTIDPDQDFSGQGTEVFGLAPDSVRSIKVLVNGDEYPARLDNNAYFYQLQDGAAFPSALEVTYDDGTVANISIAPPPS
jgi:hypothetical protein